MNTTACGRVIAVVFVKETGQETTVACAKPAGHDGGCTFDLSKYTPDVRRMVMEWEKQLPTHWVPLE